MPGKGKGGSKAHLEKAADDSDFVGEEKWEDNRARYIVVLQKT